MTAFVDALDLRTAVIEQVGSAEIADVFPRLVKMAEVVINRRLRVRGQIQRAVLAVTGNQALLPADFIEVIGVYSASGLEYIGQPLQAVRSPGSHGYFAISESRIVIDGASEISLEYYAKVPTISGALSSSNWLLASAPGLYLYAVAHEAAKHLRNVEAAQAFGQLAGMEFDAMAAIDHGERYSRARVRVQGVTP